MDYPAVRHFMYTSLTMNSTTDRTLGLLSVKFTARWYVVRQLSFVIPSKGRHGNGARPLRHFDILAMSNFWWLMSSHIIIYKMILNQRRLGHRTKAAAVRTDLVDWCCSFVFTWESTGDNMLPVSEINLYFDPCWLLILQSIRIFLTRRNHFCFGYIVPDKFTLKKLLAYRNVPW
jgi:hypothetical protein